MKRETLIALITDHLRLGTAIDATTFRGGRNKFWGDESVVTIKKRKVKDHGQIWEANVWIRARDFSKKTRDGKRQSRKAPDKTLWITPYGEFLPQPKNGRPSVASTKALQHLYVSLLGWQMNLAAALPKELGFENTFLYRQCLYGALAKQALRLKMREPGLYCRYIHNGTKDGHKTAWQIYRPDDSIMPDQHGQPLSGHPSEWQAWRDAYHRIIERDDYTILDS